MAVATPEQREQIQSHLNDRGERIDKFAKACKSKNPNDPANPDKPEGPNCKEMLALKRKFDVKVGSYSKLIVRDEICKTKPDSTCIFTRATLSQLEQGWLKDIAEPKKK